MSGWHFSYNSLFAESDIQVVDEEKDLPVTTFLDFFGEEHPINGRPLQPILKENKCKFMGPKLVTSVENVNIHTWSTWSVQSIQFAF